MLKQDNNNLIKVTFKHNGVEKQFPVGISLLELATSFEEDFISQIVAAKVDNDLKELNYKLDNDCTVQFIDLTHSDGIRIYRRSLYFILVKAVYDLFPDRKVVINHPISKGMYCEVVGDSNLTEDEVKKIEDRMREIVDECIPFERRVMTIEEAREIFIKSGRLDRLSAVEHRQKPYVTIYNCGGFEDYFYGYMAPHTGYVKLFSLEYYAPGLILRYPEKTDPYRIPEFQQQQKLFNIFSEFGRWIRILEVENVGALNDMIKKGCIGEIIKINEALHEKKIAQIADMITGSKDNKRIVLISGPSSSGKTTFAHRLAVQLRVNGKRPVTISIDDYFLNRENTPIDEDGEYDFEALEAIDVDLFNSQLNDLINSREVEIPIYNFTKGCRESVGRKLQIDDDQILIIEGIHGLNEKLTSSIPRESKFKIYVSALTSMNIDDHNRIPTTDTRMIRRIVRDHKFRGSSALSTIKRWPSVRRGEKKNIFPYQEEADVMFNSAMIYELGVLKSFAEPLLAEIDNSYEEYSEAKRLIGFLSYFLPIEPNEIPLNSILREFIGGSSFY